MRLSGKLRQAIVALSLALLVAFGSIFKLPQLALSSAGLSISAAFVAAFSDRATAASLKVFPSDFMTNVKTSYGAVGDGVTDDTAAIQRALNDGRSGEDDYGRPKAIYFPAGTYLVNNTLA